MICKKGMLIGLEYELLIAGEISKGQTEIILGEQQLFPRLEAALEGKSVGEIVEVEIPPEEAFGKAQESQAHKVPRESFPEELELELGMQLMGQDLMGEQRPVWVIDLDPEFVTLDFVHPLAGTKILAKAKILSIHDE